MSGSFALVREAFTASPIESLQRLGIEIKSHEPKGDWLQVACPMCPDKSGSASISIKSGFLRCHQCGSKDDLFTWWGAKNGHSAGKPFEACKTLAQILNVQLPEREKRKAGTRTWPKEMTVEIAAEATRSLLEDDDCAHLRKFLTDRNKDKVLNVLLVERLRIGAINGEIVLPQYSWDGRLRPRYRRYNPSAVGVKWRWSKGDSGAGPTTGLWPYLGPIGEKTTIWVCEGEWDVWTALNVLDFEAMDIMPVTWTGGAGGNIPAHVIPESWRGHTVEICYDNDTFQGPGDAAVAPDDKKMIEMLRRRKNLIEGVGDSFAANRCPVFLRAIPINPLERWGADLRDWANDGHRDIKSIPCWPLEQARKAAPKAKEIKFSELFTALYQEVKFRCQVHAINNEVMLVPITSTLRCGMNTKPICATSCEGPNIAPGGVIDWRGRQEDLANALCARNPEEWIIQNVVGKPRSCTPCSVRTFNGTDGAGWIAQACEGEDEQRVVEVISSEAPPLSGELEVQGYVYPQGKSVVVWCNRLVPLDKQVVDFEPIRVDLLAMVPHKTDDPDEIDAYLARRHRSISNHVTHVFGRQDIHTALELVAHSALWMNYEGMRKRGWLDACIIGATRSGKSVTARNYIQFIGVGQHFTMMGNFSRAGFTMGSANVNGVQKMKPGLLPRNHGKMAIVDEAHLMMTDTSSKEPLFPMLQAARDIGRVEGTKIYGSQSLPAAVRLVAISNWLGGAKRSYAHPCQHLLALYGSPESLSRTDFAIPVDELTEGVAPEDCENEWTQELVRAMVIRAWNLEPEQIRVAKEAVALAKQVVLEEWSGRYSEDLPLYTQQEKVLSVLRIAIAIANLTMSHIGIDLLTCDVRVVHVKWAIRWLEHTWDLLGYETYSQSAIASQKVNEPFVVEHNLTGYLGLDDPVHARNVLPKMIGMVNKEELRSVIGLDYQAFEKWLMGMFRRGVFELVGGGTHTFYLRMRLTKGGDIIVQNAITCAEQYPEAWEKRVQRVRNWVSSKTGGNINAKINGAPEGIIPLDSPAYLLIHEWSRSADAESSGGEAASSAS